jgi:hypothetical protein
MSIFAAAARRAKHQKPAACFARRVQPLLQKYISFRNAEMMIKRTCPALAKEAFRDRHDNVARDAMDVLISQASDIDTYGQAVWS